jgi:TetR/AcrR family transcriptional regulator
MARQTTAWAARTSREGRDSETRDLLLGCAARVFARLGYARTTIADISAEAELGRATFYVYFASRAAVFLAVANRVRSDILAVHDLPQDVQDDPQLLARASSAAYLRARVDNRELMTVIGHQALDDPDIAAIWHEIRDRPVGRTVRHIKSLVDQGKARPAVSAEATAHATYGVADRFAELIAVDPSTFDQKAAELSAIYLRLLGMDR